MTYIGEETCLKLKEKQKEQGEGEQTCLKLKERHREKEQDKKERRRADMSEAIRERITTWGL